MNESERSKLLSVAGQLLRERALEDVKAADIGDRAGVSAADVEAQLGSPEEVLIAVVTLDDIRLERQVEAEVEGLTTSSDKLVAVIQHCVLEHDWSFWMELWSAALRSPVAADARQELDDRFRSMIEEIIREGQARGEFEPGDPVRLAVTISTIIDSFAVMATLGDSTVSANYMLEGCGSVAGALLGVDLRGRFSRRDGTTNG